MANNIKWIKSSKGKDQLVVDDFIFYNHGKGKAAGIMYWTCSSPGCKVNAKTVGNQLLKLNGLANPPDHGHINDSKTLFDSTLKVHFM
jgi:FLYWCH zinc finger domain